ncbi:PAP2 domain protein [Pseudovirgaria hyperparasitica]|uniref:PAP2 domain protein n=1 Tax=Pseudovirgaria hyperparasitica TaxID=470096 RepID=A0A6A6W0J9_9PEZI|nr:PAP2 domain protein [Pseudovirgaria hyperparasitica]KAF2754591.1 PAP2 domain protein [Pseudovirgaria hyperparasitica]
MNKPDAGMRDVNHYANKLPKWRHAVRQFLIPIVRAETPYLACMQEKYRTPALDSYFAFTANLGTHTFFMIMLPILFWCGYTSIGRAMVNVLAAGVFWSGFVKDMLCLPRPLSPPLQRITMSGSAALEYGFPSTHSTNAISVAVCAIHGLRQSTTGENSTLYLVFQGLFCFYGLSIVVGRLYCGMHGFFDVVIGSILGALIGLFQIIFGDWFDLWITQDHYINPLIAVLIILVLVRIHPEPADDCPCFDDSVSFAGTVIGCQIGMWHYSQTSYSTDSPIPGTVPYDLQSVGWLYSFIRLVIGVLVIFAWRGTMKPTLLKILPPVFRVIESAELNLPRRFFLQASQYTSVPNLRKDDNVIPPASDLPRLFTTLRHPRKRAISVGPQSAADAYETLAYRQRKRRESMDSDRATSPGPKSRNTTDESHSSATSSNPNRPLKIDILAPQMADRLNEHEKAMGTGDISKIDIAVETPMGERINPLEEEEEREDREMFDRLERPRVRYDVEVVTKLIIYSGIGWLAVEGNPFFFELVGLGMRGS